MLRKLSMPSPEAGGISHLLRYTKLIVRPASADDLPSMMALEKHAATAAHWTVAQYEALFGVAGAERIALVIPGVDTQPGDENEQTENEERIVLKGASVLGFIV